MQDKTVLICDDDPAILDVLQRLFQPHCKVIAEPDSQQVITWVEKHKPDVLLVDLWMPYLSGDQMIRLLKKNKAAARMRIVAISANPNGERVALGAGADHFFAKPFDVNELFASVKTMMEQKTND
ncbi:response regulator [Terrimonas sp. NA20]|uniref:Response regulator n=1 Tax=Terrimonas ginsenosidimutans TaxID=2908004 RepID=A0ABS9KLX4_9BACT|nr:response regulator [Terrimonas ginsenosidimutans]MCG2613326.1 response regulator [Terrimonas ginsenosidimutans]